MKKVNAKNLREKIKNDAEYLFIKVTVEEKDFYCVYSGRGGSALECVGESYETSSKAFETLADNEVSATHLSEVVGDMKNEIFA